LIRLAEASAKSRLADTVELSDAERAIALTEFMFKTLSMDSSGRRDIDVILTGMPKEKVDKLNILLNIIKDLEEKEGYASNKQLYVEAEKAGMTSDLVNKYVKELERSGDIYMPKAGMYKTVKHEAE
jgi:replicative DNA helicase Mcm